jgi:hypothetical protein
MSQSARTRRARIAVPLSLALAAVAAAGRPAPAQDERATIALGQADREHLLAGMRGYLASIQGIVDGLSRSDMKDVAESARKSGAAGVADVKLSAVIGLPPDFLLASMATHQKFDELADAAKSGATRLAVLDSLSGLLASCNACHEAYRLAAR